MPRVGTFNAHGWCDRNGRRRVDDAIGLLESLRADVLLLNEVPLDATLERVASALGMTKAYAPAQWQGNAILARPALENVRRVSLDVPGAETRSAVTARVELEGRALSVACTHLDVDREATRVAQMSRLDQALAVVGGRWLIGGDLNALRLSDYPPEALEGIRRHRARGGCEAPANELVELLDGRGYVDAARLADAGSQEYAAALTRPIDPALRATCWAGTRIDYVWLNAHLASEVAGLQAVVLPTDVSDHDPLLVSWED